MKTEGEKIFIRFIPTNDEVETAKACNDLLSELDNFTRYGLFLTKISCHRLPLWNKMQEPQSRSYHFYFTVSPADKPKSGDIALIFSKTDAEFEREKQDLFAKYPAARESFVSCIGTLHGAGSIGISYQ